MPPDEAISRCETRLRGTKILEKSSILCYNRTVKSQETPILTVLKRYGPAVLMMALIFFASSLTSQEIPKFGVFDFSIKKLGHASGYVLLYFSYLHALGKNDWRSRLLALFLAFLYACTDEFHQSFTPGRSPSPIDVGIDTAGALVAMLVAAWLQSHFYKNHLEI